MSDFASNCHYYENRFYLFPPLTKGGRGDLGESIENPPVSPFTKGGIVRIK
jgi:hypothetical protein